MCFVEWKERQENYFQSQFITMVRIQSWYKLNAQHGINFGMVKAFIAVSFNYRLGALGFLLCSLAAEERILNLGLRD